MNILRVNKYLLSFYHTEVLFSIYWGSSDKVSTQHIQDFDDFIFKPWIVLVNASLQNNKDLGLIINRSCYKQSKLLRFCWVNNIATHHTFKYEIKHKEACWYRKQAEVMWCFEFVLPPWHWSLSSNSLPQNVLFLLYHSDLSTITIFIY